ncbi:hypothetical protein JD844_002505 [Phrynosoma platyrhinos]|uniref:Centrosomal protein of 162 kDa n=1 Tax=Phrynosoma platyrhinos TaxID=52577 RepID=A0ABQ7TBJ0_PHRPL|nr:hypothetical protein JD844_002505 [Phrynosoma platyrhinos]
MLSVREADKEYRGLPNSSVLPVTHGTLGQGNEKRKIGIRVAFLEDKSQELSKQDPNLKFLDEAEANEKITTYANFTPHPASPGVSEPLVTSQKAARRNQIQREPELQMLSGKSVITQGTVQMSNKVSYEAAPMERLLDLVDKYWNGSKSLHCNQQFLSQAETVLSEIQKSAPTEHKKKTLEDQNLNDLLLEKKTLQKDLSRQEEEYSVKINNLKLDLDNTKKEMEVLKQHLDNLLKENAALKVHNSKIEQNIEKADTAAPAPLQTSRTELTLVSTNERLLKELDETRLRHKAEVEQLQWNYDQLKKTVDTLPPSNVK